MSIKTAPINIKKRLITLCVLLLLSPLAARAQFPKWISIDKRTMKNWKMAYKSRDGKTIKLRARFKTGLPRLKKVFVLFPKKSSAYNISIRKILNHFHEQKIAALFTIFNYKGKKDIGKIALRTMLANKNDLMLTMGSKSTAFTFKNYRRGTVPVVSVCSKDPVLMGQMKNYTSGSGNNFAFTSLNVPVKLQLPYLTLLKPKLRAIAILYARKNTSAVKTQVIPLKKLAKQLKIRTIDIIVNNQKNARNELSAAIPAAILKLKKIDPSLKNTLFWITGSTSVFREIKTINRFAGNIPVLSAIPNVVKEGNHSAVISIGVSFANNAHLAAIYAVNILTKKTKPGLLKVGIVSPPDIAINFKKAKKIGLKIPFSFLESASFIYNYQGKKVRDSGRNIKLNDKKSRNHK